MEAEWGEWSFRVRRSRRKEAASGMERPMVRDDAWLESAPVSQGSRDEPRPAVKKMAELLEYWRALARRVG